MNNLDSFSGFFLGNHQVAVVGVSILILIFGFRGVPLIAWTLLAFVTLLGFNAPLWLSIPVIVIALIFNIRPLRKALVSTFVMKILKAL